MLPDKIDRFRQISDVILESVLVCTAPISWTYGPSEPGGRPRNGTVFFLRTREHLFGVTAAHVIAGWKDDCAQRGPTPLFIVGSKGRFDLPWDARELDSHPDIDIATFMITDREVSALGRLAYQGAIGDEAPSRGDLIGLAGFPALGTRRPNVAEVVYGALVATGEVTAIGDRYIKSQAEREYWEPALGGKLLPEEFPYGGISGGPMIWAHISAGGLLVTSLAGVVIEGPNSSPDPNQSIAGFEVITARRSHFIRADGFLDVRRWENTW